MFRLSLWWCCCSLGSGSLAWACCACQPVEVLWSQLFQVLCSCCLHIHAILLPHMGDHGFMPSSQSFVLTMGAACSRYLTPMPTTRASSYHISPGHRLIETWCHKRLYFFSHGLNCFSPYFCVLNLLRILWRTQRFMKNMKAIFVANPHPPPWLLGSPPAGVKFCESCLTPMHIQIDLRVVPSAPPAPQSSHPVTRACTGGSIRIALLEPYALCYRSSTGSRPIPPPPHPPSFCYFVVSYGLSPEPLELHFTTQHQWGRGSLTTAPATLFGAPPRIGWGKPPQRGL